MIRKCTVCKITIHVRHLKEKYCKECAIIQQRERNNRWMRENSRRDYDFFCLQCNKTLPNFMGGRKYCEICINMRTKEKRKQYVQSKKIKNKLDKFYKNLRINLIASPYLIDRRKIELPLM